MGPIEEVLAAYQKVTGTRFPPVLLRPIAAERLDLGGVLVASPAATAKLLLAQAEIFGAVDSCPEGYYLIGFWGHGVNSYAFYYQLVEPRRTILLRIPYGGVYSDNDKQAVELRGFLEAFARLLQRLGSHASHLLAIDSMGDGRYRLRLATGELIEHNQSFLGTPDFESVFSAALEQTRPSP